jgi:CRISPR-associated protein Cmr2
MELQPQYYPQNIYALASGHDEMAKLKSGREPIILSTKIDGLINHWYDLGFDKADRDDLIHYPKIKGGIYSFPSILEIATKGLSRLNPDLYDTEIHTQFEQALREEIEKKLRKAVQRKKRKKMRGKPHITTDTEILVKIKETFPDTFQTAHKYIALVIADGDNMGKLINYVAEKHDNELLNTVSKMISDFAKEAANLIYQYGGKPVYIGGDDLLFFAPVISYSGDHSDLWFEGNAHIFQLIRILDKKFDSIWMQWLKDNNITDIKPSLSYGVSITYYKFPLNEAMTLSHDLLFDYAKKGNKNRIAIQLMTHSGNFNNVFFEKHNNDSTFYHLLKLLENFADKESTISSVLQRLRNDTDLLLTVAKDNDDFTAYFVNEYDLHKMDDQKKKAFIEHSISLFNEIFRREAEKTEALNQLCSMYRLLNFLIHKDTEDGNTI